MKSFFSRAAVFLFALTAFPVFGQGVDQSTTNLGDVVIRFCNNIDDRTEAKNATKSLYMEAKTGEPEDICIYINNAGPTDITAKLNFVDGTVTADQSQKKACQPEGTKSNFGQYVTIEDDTVEVRAGKTVETHATLTFPSGYAGMSYGCATLQIEGQSESGNPDSMFKILSRRANFIDVLVDGDIVLDMEILQQPTFDLGNIGTSPSLLVYTTPENNAYQSTISIKNNGNVAQEVTVNPRVSTWFQPQRKGSYITEKVIEGDAIKNREIFSWNNVGDASGTPMTKKILPGQQVSFDFNLTETIPLREGSVTVDADITSTPLFDFESDNITDAMRASKTQTISSQFFILPRKLIIALLIVLTILWILLTRKKGGDTTTHKNARTPSSTSGGTRRKAVPTAKKRKATAKKTTTTKKKTTTKSPRKKTTKTTKKA